MLMSEARERQFRLPADFVPRVRGAAPVVPLVAKTGPNGTQELPVVRNDSPKPKKDKREYTGEPRPFLPRAFWPKALGLFVLAVFGIGFLAVNNFEFSAFMAFLAVSAFLGLLLFIGYLIAKASKRDDDHSNPKQGPDKVEDHRGH
jgi:hypothetical protein